MILLVTACGTPDAPKTPLGGSGAFVPDATTSLPEGLNASAAARLDSANIAFRLKQYDQALRYYRAATTDVPDHPAPWYGIYMVAAAVGNTALADSANRAVALRSGGRDLLDTGMMKAHKGTNAPVVPPALHPKTSPKVTPP